MTEGKLVDCPYYAEFMTGRSGNSPMNCWDNDFMYDDGRTDCNVPGCRSPLCNPKTNGYNKDGVFIAKVNEIKLNDALKQYKYEESLKPLNIIKRLDKIEKRLEEAGIE